MNLLPMAGRLFVRPEVAEITKGGIIIPENSRQAPTEGIVLAVGLLKDKRIKEGSLVLFRMHADEEIHFQGEKFFMIIENDVLATYNED